MNKQPGVPNNNFDTFKVNLQPPTPHKHADTKKGDPNMFPANLLKFSACIDVMHDPASAILRLSNKRLAYGEPAVVMYKDTSTGKKRVMFAVGSMDVKNPYIFGTKYTIVDSSVQNIVTIEEVLDEFGGKEIPKLRYSKNQADVNLGMTFNEDSKITLGEAAIKEITDTVLENSKDLVTAGGVYAFIRDLEENLEERVEKLEMSDTSIYIKIGSMNTLLDNTIEDVNILSADMVDLSEHVEFVERDTSLLVERVDLLEKAVGFTVEEAGPLEIVDASDASSRILRFNFDTNVFDVREENGGLTTIWGDYE